MWQEFGPGVQWGCLLEADLGLWLQSWGYQEVWPEFGLGLQWE